MFQRRAKEGLLKDLPQSAFTVSSTDNVDVDQPNTAVYAGCQQRSWHGTSVQVVQPHPQSLKVPSESEGSSSTPEHSPMGLSSQGETMAKPIHSPMVTGEIGTVQLRKRTERSSPVFSPSLETRSPNPK